MKKKEIVSEKFIDEDLERKKEGTLNFLKLAINDPSILEREDVYSIARDCIDESLGKKKKGQS